MRDLQEEILIKKLLVFCLLLLMHLFIVEINKLGFVGVC